VDLDGVISAAFKILAVVVLVGLNGFFVASEFALVKIRETQLAPLIRRGQRRARMVRHLLSHLDAYLSAAQLGITLASLGLGWVAEPIFAALLRPVFQWLDLESEQARTTLAFAVGFSVITFLHIVAGEMAPKSLAIRKPLTTSLWIAYPFHWFYVAMKPFIVALNESSLLLLKWVMSDRAAEHESAHSEDELRLLFSESQRRQGESSLGREIVLNALDLRRRVVRDAMRPRQEIATLDTRATIDECLDVADRTRYSRFPLCEEGDVDHALVCVHIKDLYALRRKGRTGADLLAAGRKLLYVPETARLEQLLHSFLEQRLHMALVVDEYGATLGLVTLENILEELVGPIQDEFDQEKPLLVQTGTDTWEASGALPLRELEQIAGELMPTEDLSTVSGYLTRQLGGFPKVGDTVAVGDWLLRVENVERRRVARLKITRRAPP
jgi:CBS domain containing-hemolysin-like protein